MEKKIDALFQVIKLQNESLKHLIAAIREMNEKGEYRER